MTQSSAPSDSLSRLGRFRHRFWQPPRPHGDVLPDRSVGFLEVFYDLIYIVIIARAAHALAEGVTWSGVGVFAAVFGMIWIAWMNGALYHEFHAREDGRSRSFVFLQMLLLALVAVFAADAAGDDGRAFALAYAAFLAVVAWLGYTVRRQDTEEYLPWTDHYTLGMILSIVVVATSAALPDQARLVLWAAFVFSWVIGILALDRTSRLGPRFGLVVSDSLVERFGLFTIIVLGEVVVGVIAGLSETARDFRSVATGLIGLMVGFGIWWTYFDFVGRRLPRDTRGAPTQWIFSHLPVTMSIAASGAAMVSLIEHAGNQRAPTSSAWLLGGSIALALTTLIATAHSLRDFRNQPSVYRPLSMVLSIGAASALLAAWWRPTPWLLMLTLVFILLLVWLAAIDRSWRLEA